MPARDHSKTCTFDVCGKCKTTCCLDANPPLTRQREKTITEYLHYHKQPSENVFVHAEYDHPAVDSKGYCTFLNKETGKCRIHPVKPETCRAGPVTFDINLTTRKVEWFLKKGEICALAEQLHQCGGNRFHDHFEAAKTELMHLICEFDGEALEAILRIPEPQTFKIGESDLPKEIWHKLGIA
jgi:Fe-S-cluster containining protein